MLEEIADRIEGNAAPATHSVEESHELLNKTVEASQGNESVQLPAGRAQSFLTLLRGMDGLTTSLMSEIAGDFASSPCITS